MRVPEWFTPEESLEALQEAFGVLFALYGEAGGFFDVTCTANAVLRGEVDGNFSCFYGMDFSGIGDVAMGAVTTVRNLGDVSSIPTHFGIDDFEDAFRKNFESSSVTVQGLINFVFVIRRYLGNFDRDHRSGGGGRRLVEVY